MADTIIGRYQIVEALGSGGMATVYLARDPYMKREVALKLMSAKLLTDADFYARFEREAQTVAALEHPNIVPVYDFGYHEQQPYIVMRCMRGGSVKSHLIKDGPFPIEKAAGIIDRMAAALDDAHKNGVIHRDFKPHNILLDDYGKTYLADFGLVKVLTEGTASTSGMYVIGTAGYLSPEQVHGEGAIDGRADVYAMGVTLFEMLTGSPPYHHEDRTKLMMMHVLTEPPRLSRHMPGAPADVEAVILRAMAKSPDARYASAGEFATALNATKSWWSILSDRAKK